MTQMQKGDAGTVSYITLVVVPAVASTADFSLSQTWRQVFVCLKPQASVLCQQQTCVGPLPSIALDK